MSKWKECPKCKCMNKDREQCQDCGRALIDVAEETPVLPIMTPPIAFTVIGKPAPAGSKKAFPLRRGGVFVRSIIVDDSGAKGKSWRALVQDRAREAFIGAPLTGPVRLTLRFIRARPKGHFNKKGLKPTATSFPTSRPDVLKLTRAIEDALTGIIWKDDSQITSEHLYKRYGEADGVNVTITEDAE